MGPLILGLRRICHRNSTVWGVSPAAQNTERESFPKGKWWRHEQEIAHFAFLTLALGKSNHALAQTPGGLMNMFTAIMGAAIVNNARVEWSKIRSNETRVSSKNYVSRAFQLAD